MTAPEPALTSAAAYRPTPCPQREDRRPLDQCAPSPAMAHLLRNHQPPFGSTFQSAI